MADFIATCLAWAFLAGFAFIWVICLWTAYEGIKGIFLKIIHYISEVI